MAKTPSRKLNNERCDRAAELAEKIANLTKGKNGHDILNTLRTQAGDALKEVTTCLQEFKKLNLDSDNPPEVRVRIMSALLKASRLRTEAVSRIDEIDDVILGDVLR